MTAIRGKTLELHREVFNPATEQLMGRFLSTADLRMRVMMPLCLLGLATATSAESPWQMVRVGPESNTPLSGIVFVDDKTGWMCAGLNTILKTIDGGRNWSALKTNLLAPESEISRLWFADESRGWAAGKFGRQPAIWETGDGGVSWTIEYLWSQVATESVGAMLDIRFADKTHGWAVGFNGSKALIVATTDGGRHWNTQYSGSDIAGQFSLVRFTDTLHGWVLSYMGVMQTEDGGESWSLRYSDAGLLNDIAVMGSSEVWVAGAWGSLFHTRDGIGWSQVRPADITAEDYLGWVKFGGQDVGWASGAKGKILLTSDGGRTWKRDALPEQLLGSEMSTGEMAVTGSRVFIIANPGHLLIRPIH